MSFRDRIGVLVHETEELTLSYSPLSSVGQQQTFISEEAIGLYDSPTEHQTTSHVISGRAPWLCVTTSATSPSDDYAALVWKCQSDADMAAVEAAMTGTEPFFVDRFTFNDTTKRVTAYIDASAYWQLEDWTDCAIPNIPRWTATKVSVLHPGSELVCTIPRTNGYSFNRKAVPLLAGQSIEVPREGEHCHLVSIFSDISSSGKTLSKKRFIELSSDAPVVTTEQDTILVKIYR